MGIRWATILAIAFCAIDFAGIAHLFIPKKGLVSRKKYGTSSVLGCLLPQ